MTTTFLLTVIAFVTAVNAADQAACANKWTYDKDSWCYMQSPRPYSYDYGSTYCDSVGGNMVEIRSPYDDQFLESFTADWQLPPFVGAQNNGSQYYWATGGSVGTAWWIPYEPKKENGDCATYHSITGEYGGLQVTGCHFQQPILCRQPAATCNGGQFGGRSGTINSPNYPNNYYNNLNCVYTIKGSDPNTYVTINFDPYVVEDERDYVTLYEGDSTDDKNMIARLLKSNPDKASYESVTNIMTVVFYTDFHDTFKGWQAQYTIKMRTDPIYSNTSTGELSSPNYPNNYPDFLEQYYYITVPQGFTITATFDHFETEESADILQIFDSPTDDMDKWLGTYSGSQPPFLVSSTTNTMTLKFFTDGSINRKGWHLKYISA